MGECEGGEQGEEHACEEAAPSAAGEPEHTRAREQDDLEVIDGRAGPLKIFVVLELENEKRQQHAHAQPANRGASGGDEQPAQRADEQIADRPDDREIDGAGGPVTGGKQQAAGERAVLVTQSEEVGDDFRPGGAAIEAQQQEEGGVEFVPIGDVPRDEQGVGEDINDRNQPDHPEGANEGPLAAEKGNRGTGSGHDL